MKSLIPVIVLLVDDSCCYFAGMSILRHNPCSMENVRAERMYHPYPYDVTKYVQCSEFGHAHVMSCPPGQQWSQFYETCVMAHSVGLEYSQQYNTVNVAVPPVQAPVQAPVQPPVQPPAQPPVRKMQASQYAYRYSNGHQYGNQVSYTSQYHSQNNQQYMSTQAVGNSAYLYVIASQGGMPDQLHCESRHARYMSMPGNAHMYYECVEGTPREMSCPDKQVWVNPLRKCMPLQPQPAAQPAEPSHNPCVGLDSRYHPFPSDPRKYMECTTWQRVTVWECGPQQMWSQQTQSCVDQNVMTPVIIIQTPIMQPQPPIQPPIEPRSPAPQPSTPVRPVPRSSNPCLYSKSYYHPYPGNATLYIQCDEYGNAFIRRCGTYKVWDDFYKTCVGRENAAGDSETRDSIGGVFIDGEGEIINVMESSGTVASEFSTSARASADFPPVSGRSRVVVSGSDVAVPNGNQGPCPPGTVYDAAANLCLRIAVDVSANSMTGPNCARGNVWDPAAEICIPIVDTIEAPGMTMLRTFESSISNDVGNRPQDDGINTVDQFTGDNTIIYSGSNPCGSEKNVFYYPFPDNPHYYIQCDQMSNVFIQPCDIGEIWSQEILTCVPDLAEVKAVIPETSTDAKPVESNPCQTSDLTYHQHPDKQHFVMCVAGIPYPMQCPYGAFWWEDVKTCYWPVGDPAHSFTAK